MSIAPPITVIIPTLALAQRAAHLRRAIASVLQQDSVRGVPLVVVNGRKASTELVEQLTKDPEVRLISLPYADLPAALREGRCLVDSQWFAELDDDDFLFRGALAMRLRRLECDPTLDAVISNGIIRGPSEDRPAIEDLSSVVSDPLSALGRRHWLCPGSALFRTSSVDVRHFEGMPSFLEWTYLALILAKTRRLGFMEELTFVHHTDSPLRTWMSDACILGLPAAMEQILSMDLPEDLRKVFARRLAGARNRAAVLSLCSGDKGKAWLWHLKCLAGPTGWRYLPFTRKLIGGQGGPKLIQS